tara:strand:+ start:723 stop:887 length:165 start_codon:yes stop_codon:yes gene_type:complete
MSLIKLTYLSPALLPPNVICQLYAQQVFFVVSCSLRVWLSQEGKKSNYFKVKDD